MNDQLDLFTFSQEEKKEPEIIRCRHCKYYVPNYQPPKVSCMTCAQKSRAA